MIREASRRLIEGFGLVLALLILAPLVPAVILFGRRTYAEEIGSGASCLLNAATGGSRTVTFSAWSALLLERGKPGAALRVRAVDLVNLAPGHCAEALASHRDRGLI
ncbi:hypothetical protein VQH23_16325 [Pararoseomonas sp. SCSIO 73927]|uniref:hypothetical protein n=1 Tax=Pararoseomonas sp. SCSIO 73927 TaxID=3114537 RepID=UPI0030CD89F8